MQYLFLMFYRYNSNGKETKSTAYIGALFQTSIFIVVILNNLLKLTGWDFKIPFWGESTWLNYILSGIMLLPINIFLYLLYPPKKVKVLNLSYKNNIFINVVIIAIFIVLFFTQFVK